MANRENKEFWVSTRISKRDHDALQARAKRLGVKKSVLVRQGLDLILTQGETKQEARR